MRNVIAITPLAVLVTVFFAVPHKADAANTVIYITNTAQTSWTVPSDWNSNSNTIEVIGGGGGGRSSVATGGGGGGYSRKTNVSLTPGSTVTIQVGEGGAIDSAGEDTYLCNSTSNCADITGSAVQVGAKGGSRGTDSGASNLGGQASAGVGDVKYSGGGVTGPEFCGTLNVGPGGGAAGPYGNGGNGLGHSWNCDGLHATGGGGGGGGGSNGSYSGNAHNGGNGGNNYVGSGGGSGGTSGAGGSSGTAGGGGGSAASTGENDGGNGGDGTEWDATHGSGGGAGAGANLGGGGSNGGTGGLYGGGGGGGWVSGGPGAQGIIVITYTADCTWYDNANPTTADGTQNNAGSSFFRNTGLTLPAGTVKMLRFNFNQVLFGQTIEYALYDSNGNVVAAAANSAKTGLDFWLELDTSTTPTIASGSYKFGMAYQGNGSDAQLNTLSGFSSGTTYIDFDCPYNVFPCDPMPSPDASYTVDYYVGACIQPSTGRSTLSRPANNLGLVAYFPFNEGTSTTAGDFSGKKYLGTLTGSSVKPTWVSGKLGGGLRFVTGTDNYVSIPAPDTDFISALTISAWVKYSSLGGMVASKLSSNGGALNAFDFQVTSGNRLYFVRAAGSYCSFQSNAVVTPDVWHHVAVTTNSSEITTTPVMYLDGQSITVNAGACPGSGSASNGGTPILVGRRDDGESQADGTIDDLRIYNRALSSTEIAALARTNSKAAKIGGGETLKVKNNLIGHWTFNGTDMNWTSETAGYAYDKTGGNNHGTLNSMNQSTSPRQGKIGQGLYFSGNYITVANESNFDFDTSNPFSIAAWVKHENDVSGADTIASKIHNGGNYHGFQFDLPASTLNLRVFIIGSNGGQIVASTAETSMPVRVWKHAVMTYDGSGTGAGIRLYIDGVHSSSGSGTLSASPLNDASFIIGNNPPAGGSNFQGVMDDVRVYNKKLTDAEVKQLYQMGAGTVIRNN